MSSPTPEQLKKLSPEYLTVYEGKKLMDISVAFLAIVPFFFVLFVTSRIFHGVKDTWEVWFLPTLSTLCCVALCVIGILMIKIGGTGRHVEYHMIYDPTSITNFLQLQTAAEFIYMLAVTAPKLTVLTLYLRIFSVGTSRILRYIPWATIVAVVLQWLTVGIVVWASICQPFRFRWDKRINGHCANVLAVYRYVSVPNILTDLVILVLPISTIRNLQVSRMKRVGIFLTFLIGGSGIVVAIIRFVGFFTAALFTDPTYVSVTTMRLTVVEPGAYCICSTLPYINPLLRSFFQNSGITIFLSRIHHSMVSTRRSSKFASPKQSKSGFSAAISTAGPSNIDYDRSEFIELVDTVEVNSSHNRGS